MVLRGYRLCQCAISASPPNQAAIVALFRVMNRYVGNLPPMLGVSARFCYAAASDVAITHATFFCQKKACIGRHAIYIAGFSSLQYAKRRCISQT
jgi:hypothetical protein